MPDNQNLSTISITINAGDYSLVNNSDGTVSILMEGYGSEAQSGAPLLPAKTIHVVLPRGTQVSRMSVDESRSVELKGVFQIQPAPAMVHDRSLDERERIALLVETERERAENYDRVYGSDELYPKHSVALVGDWQGRDVSQAHIRFFPFQFRPNPGKLFFNQRIRISIEYEYLAEHHSFELADNFSIGRRINEAVDPSLQRFSYRVHDTTEMVGVYNYVIIVPDRAVASAVADFKAWKERIGHSVAVVQLDDILRNYNGIDQAEQIRNFLIEKFEEWGIRYALLVGDLDVIPTRLLYPAYNPFVHYPQTPYAADFYYADLRTVNWDIDGDNQWGEFVADKFNWHHDIVVGRLPFNHPDDIEVICANTVRFERDTGLWKHSELMASGFTDHHPTDGAELSERIIADILRPMGWPARTLYEQSASGTTMPSQYTSDLALNQANFVQECNHQRFGLVCLTAHGAPNRMVSKQCVDPNGNCDATSGAKQDNEFAHANQITPNLLTSVIYMNGCSTACPVPNYSAVLASGQGTLFPFTRTQEHNGRRYLSNGAVVVIGASAGADYAHRWTHPNHGGCWSLAYYFHRHLISHGKTVGDAFFDAAVEQVDRHQLARGLRVFHLLGDPTLLLEGVHCDEAGREDVVVHRDHTTAFAGCNDANGDMYIVVAIGPVPQPGRLIVYKSTDHGSTWREWHTIDIRETILSVDALVNRSRFGEFEDDRLLIFYTTYDGRILIYRVPLRGGAGDFVGIPLQAGTLGGLFNQISISQDSLTRDSNLYLAYSFYDKTDNERPKSVVGVSDCNGIGWRSWTVFDGYVLATVEAGQDEHIHVAAVSLDQAGEPVCFTHSVDGGVSWSPWLNLTHGDNADTHCHSSEMPAIAVSTDPAVPAVWVAYQRSHYGIAGSRHEDIGFAYSRDNGRSWIRNETLATGPGNPSLVQLLSCRGNGTKWINAAYVSEQQGRHAVGQDTTRIFGRSVNGQTPNRWRTAHIVNHIAAGNMRPQMIYSSGASDNESGTAFVGQYGWVYFSAPWL